MNWKTEWKKAAGLIAAFLAIYYLPVGTARFDNAVMEALHLAKWYAQEHVLLCLVPAFFIAGAISVFVSQASVIKYLGAKANKVLSYGVASVSGTLLAVCSCTILPLFSGIYRMGAGLGPATAFLYSGPAINVLAIVLTARILGPELGIARAVGAVAFAIVIGLIMHFIFRDEEESQINMQIGEEEVKRPLWKNALYFASMVAILVFANWGAPEEKAGIWMTVYSAKWYLTSFAAAAFAVFLVIWFDVKWWKVAVAALPVAILAFVFPEQPLISFTAGAIALSVITSTSKDENGEWFYASWEFAKQILPLLLFGVLVAGFLLGRVDAEGVIPAHWVSAAVGGNSLLSNFIASFGGAFMYFATLTEVPIIQGLMNNGMGKGPALALLLSGPALSLPSILVIRSVMGNKKTAVFVALVVVMSTIAGVAFGALFP